MYFGATPWTVALLGHVLGRGNLKYGTVVAEQSLSICFLNGYSSTASSENATKKTKPEWNVRMLVRMLNNIEINVPVKSKAVFISLIAKLRDG